MSVDDSRDRDVTGHKGPLSGKDRSKNSKEADDKK